MKSWKERLLIAIIIISILCSITLCGGSVYAKAENNVGEGETTSSSTLSDKYNIMLVIDKSGSMNGADSDQIAQDAAKMFIDSIDAHDCNVGVESFSLTPEVVQMPTNINNVEAKELLKQSIDSIVYDKAGTGGTDLGAAVKEAAETLSAFKEDGRKNLVIFFTDGYTELDEAGLQESEVMLADGISTLNELSSEIYIIGLNYQKSNGEDSITQEGVEQIARIANDTQIGEGVDDGVNYKITYSTKDIYSFYQKIFAKLNGTTAIDVQPEIDEIDGEIYTTFPVEVSGSIIKEINIYMTSDEDIDISTLLIRDEEGKVANDYDNVDYRNGKRYAFIKLDHPNKGTWKVSLKGDIKTNLSYVVVTDIEITMKYETKDNGETRFEVFAKSGDEQVSDQEIYNSLTRKELKIFPENGAEEIIENLSYDSSLNDGKGALVDVISLEPGKYSCTVYVENNQFKREAHAVISIADLATATEPVTEATTELPTEAPTESPVTTPAPNPPVNKGKIILVIGLVLAGIIVALILAYLYKKITEYIPGSELNVVIRTSDGLQEKMSSVPTRGSSQNLYKVILIISETLQINDRTEVIKRELKENELVKNELDRKKFKIVKDDGLKKYAIQEKQIREILENGEYINVFNSGILDNPDGYIRSIQVMIIYGDR